MGNNENEDNNLSLKKKAAWDTFVAEYIEPAKKLKYPSVSAIKEYSDITIKRKSENKEYSPNMAEINFIFELKRAQDEKPALIPYIWVWALSNYTENIPVYCKEKLFKTLEKNGYQKYLGYKNGLRLRTKENATDKEIKEALESYKLDGKMFIDELQKFVKDYEIKVL